MAFANNFGTMNQTHFDYQEKFLLEGTPDGQPKENKTIYAVVPVEKVNEFINNADHGMKHRQDSDFLPVNLKQMGLGNKTIISIQNSHLEDGMLSESKTSKYHKSKREAISLNK